MTSVLEGRWTCDRCGAEATSGMLSSATPELPTFWTDLHTLQKLGVGDARRSAYHLCANCTQGLKQWLESQ